MIMKNHKVTKLKYRYVTKFTPKARVDPHTQRLVEFEVLVKTIKADTTLSKQEKLERIAKLRDLLNEETHREWKEMH